MGTAISREGITEDNSMEQNKQILREHNLYFLNEIHKIASSYIHTLHQNDLKKLADGDDAFCKNLVVLTSKIMESKFSSTQLANIDESLTDDELLNDDDKETVLYSFKRRNMIPEQKKKTLCNKIGKFYVEVAHIFSAIVKVLNPHYKTSSGKVIDFFEKFNLSKTKELSELKETDTVDFRGICPNRYKYLLMDSSENSDVYTVNRDKVCGTHGKNKMMPNLLKKNAMVHLKKQFYKDNMRDFNEEVRNNLNKLYSDEELASINFEEDEEFQDKFYKDHIAKRKAKFDRFNSDAEESIESDTVFEREKVESYRELSDSKNLSKTNKRLCEFMKHIDTNQVKIEDDKYITEYKNYLIDMMSRVQFHKEKLVDILNNKLFIKKEDSYVIQENLTYNGLKQIKDTVRKIIVSMYLTCEEDYLFALKLLERMVVFKSDARTEEKYDRAKMKVYKHQIKRKSKSDKKDSPKIEDSPKIDDGEKIEDSPEIDDGDKIDDSPEIDDREKIDDGEKIDDESDKDEDTSKNDESDESDEDKDKSSSPDDEDGDGDKDDEDKDEDKPSSSDENTDDDEDSSNEQMKSRDEIMQKGKSEIQRLVDKINRKRYNGTKIDDEYLLVEFDYNFFKKNFKDLSKKLKTRNDKSEVHRNFIKSILEKMEILMKKYKLHRYKSLRESLDSIKIKLETNPELFKLNPVLYTNINQNYKKDTYRNELFKELMHSFKKNALKV